jgi:hypothetical protein
VDGLDDQDASGQQDSSRDDYQPELLARQDTDLDADRSERDRLLLWLYEATDKDFEAHSTPELRKIWRAYREDQEASDEAEVQYPSVSLSCSLTHTHANSLRSLQIERLDEYNVAPGGGYQPSKSYTFFSHTIGS